MTTRHEIPIGEERVVAIHHEAESDRWFVCCHGFVSDKSGSYEARCERAVQEGYNAVRFDFRGCGESSRSFGGQTLSTRIEDLQAVLSYFEPSDVILFGSSFGGKVALHVAAKTDVTAVATRAPVTYNRAFEKYRSGGGGGTGTGGSVVGPTEEFFADFDQYPFDAVASTLDVPVAIFHGRADESVSVVDSLDAAGALETNVLLDLYADEGHLFSEHAEQRLRDRLFAWLDAERR